MSIVDENYKVNQPYFKNHSYLEWLESFTIDETLSDDRRPTYHKLIRKLWDIPFHGAIGNDEARGDEGLELRIRYNDILAKKAGAGEFTTPNVQDIYGECRVLEMLVALAMRMYDIMQDMGVYNSVSRWFWEIMHNVGLDDFEDGVYDILEGDRIIELIVVDILNLVAVEPGEPGGWFYVYDWQEIEIWYQMHEYLRRFFE